MRIKSTLLIALGLLTVSAPAFAQVQQDQVENIRVCKDIAALGTALDTLDRLPDTAGIEALNAAETEVELAVQNLASSAQPTYPGPYEFLMQAQVAFSQVVDGAPGDATLQLLEPTLSDMRLQLQSTYATLAQQVDC